MSKIRAGLALMVLSCAVGALSACARPPEKVTETERELRDMLQIPADARLIYQDEEGASLTAEQFKQRMQERITFAPQRDETANTVTLRIEAKQHVFERLPEFDLTRLDGGRVRNADLEGGFALVNFFFETCVPCIKEVPALNEYRRKHPEFRYLAVTFDSTSDATRFVEQHSLDWPVAAEAKAFIDMAGVRTYPTYMLLAADGRVLGQGSGMNPESFDDPAEALAELEQWVLQRMPASQ